MALGPTNHGPNYPGVPFTQVYNGAITAQSILPKAGPAKQMARTLPMVTLPKLPSFSGGGSGGSVGNGQPSGGPKALTFNTFNPFG